MKPLSAKIEVPVIHMSECIARKKQRHLGDIFGLSCPLHRLRTDQTR